MVEPVLDVIAVYLDMCGIEEASSESLVCRGRDQVIKRCELSVAFHAKLGIRMIIVVKNLELTAD